MVRVMLYLREQILMTTVTVHAQPAVLIVQDSVKAGHVKQLTALPERLALQELVVHPFIVMNYLLLVLV